MFAVSSSRYCNLEEEFAVEFAAKQEGTDLASRT